MPVKKTQKDIKKASKKLIQIEDGKVKISEFRYKKSHDKNLTTYKEREIPVSSGKVRVFLEKDGTISTKEGSEHELILGEFNVPEIEYEEIVKKVKGKEVVEKKAKPINFSEIKIKEFEIPERG